MRLLINTRRTLIILFSMLFCVVCGNATTYTYTISSSSSDGTFSGGSSSGGGPQGQTTYYNTWTSSTTSPTTLTLKSYSDSGCSTLATRMSSSLGLYASTESQGGGPGQSTSSSTSYFQLAVGDGYQIVSYTISFGTTNASASVTSGTANTVNSQTATFSVTSSGSSGGGGQPGQGQQSSSSYITPTTFTVIVAPVNYTITCNSVEGGTISASTTSAAEGDKVTLTITPETNYELSTLTVTDESGNAVDVADDYSFTMPASDVTVNATFTEKPTTVSRDVTPGTYQSFCLPFDIKLSALTDYFDKVYRISGNYVADLPNCHDDLDNAEVLSSAKAMALAPRKAVVAVSEDLDNYALCDTPFALYLNTTNHPNTFHVFMEEMPETDLDDNEMVLEANVPFYALVKDGVTTVTLSPEGDVEDPATFDTLLTTYNYVAGSSTTVQLSDVGTTEDVTEDDTVFAYNEDGTFTKADSNTVSAYHGFLLSSDSDITVIVHYGYYGDRVEMAKSATIGDANRDGDVDIADVTTVISYNLSNSPTIDKEAADADDNGKIETSDVITIVDTVLGK